MNIGPALANAAPALRRGVFIYSAEGAEYESQGQVRSEAEHVAPW